MPTLMQVLQPSFFLGRLKWKATAKALLTIRPESTVLRSPAGTTKGLERDQEINETNGYHGNI